MNWEDLSNIITKRSGRSTYLYLNYKDTAFKVPVGGLDQTPLRIIEYIIAFEARYYNLKNNSSV